LLKSRLPAGRKDLQDFDLSHWLESAMKFGDAAKSDATDSRDQRKRKAIKKFNNSPDTVQHSHVHPQVAAALIKELRSGFDHEKDAIYLMIAVS
jgi:hypothetical protein